MSDYNFFRCNFIPQKKLWAIVEDFRKKYWRNSSIPVYIENIIEAKLFLNIEPSRSIAHFSFIDAYLKSDRSAIVVNYDKYMDELNRYENRLRFSFAHEVGHFILHKYVHNKFDISTPKEYHDFITKAPQKEYRSFEWQANEFAGRLLVPLENLLEEVRIILTKLKRKNLYYLWAESPGMVVERCALNLGKIFGVSEDVIIRRIYEEKIYEYKF